ncbi:TPA: Rz-like lysis system protein LysB [Yersinia enterocolitica]|uniref:Rz-like lysis system protein LysB n=1 Tax=Yersinia enterocolitica TaxID=630 RepID=UPI000D99B199|nr:Rz-like lysis system protein LysB [Yersinia enterocolitica]SQA41426.1 putative regulatory protein [Yersinia enterocolitica]SUP66748.1 putative regulatory protein [Yersinia enterocolitica]HDL8088225.1 LysB family phage lysis regulatory protein [Yersinia enterocolitica]HDL8568769.1 LysB family phage lysis regulatory protein [Yersinia enterocolitica]HDM8273860.1 LysB family phage lysis regulatory protein [Yersinia enterocolitica]
MPLFNTAPLAWAVAAVLLVAGGVQTYRLADAQQVVIDRQADEVASKNGQLITLALTANANNQAQARLRQQVASADQLLAQRNSQLKRLYRENETLRRWADTPLPDDIIRLRQRPALTGAADYRQWLSEGHSVPVSGGQSTN